MRTARSIAIVLGLVALMAASVGSVSAGGRPSVVDMTGAPEAPGPGDPDGSGTAWVWINPGQGEVCYVLEVEDIEPSAAAHIHIAPVGSPGPVVIPLNAPTSGTSSGCASADRSLLVAILVDPSAYYVNVHNADFGGGAVRGQLGR